MKIEFDKEQFNKALDKLDQFAGNKSKNMIINAFNRAGFTARNKIKEEIPSIFKTTNDYTKNSLFFEQVRFNGKEIVGGSIGFKKKQTGKGVGAGIYLLPNEWSGSRSLKGIERKLKDRNLLPEGMFAIPTNGIAKTLTSPNAMLNFVNSLSQSTITPIKIVNNRKNNLIKISKRKSSKEYFVLIKPKGKLNAGIYERTKGRSVKLLFNYVNKVTYKSIFHFYERANKYFTQFFIEKVDDEIKKI